eukprot:SM000028S10166  [mRNA]  locus=s28:696078:698018:- [translate_table: standard]
MATSEQRQAPLPARAAQNRPRPLAQLMGRLYEARHEYKLSPAEVKELVGCRDSVRSGWLQGVVTGSCIGWWFTERRSFLVRGVSVLVLALGLGGLSQRGGEAKCIEQLLKLENSPICGELIAILEADNPNHPALKVVQQRRQAAGSAQPALDDRGYRAPPRLPFPGTRPQATDSVEYGVQEGSMVEPNGLDHGSWQTADVGRAEQVQQLREPDLQGQRSLQAPKAGAADDMFADPFTFTSSEELNWQTAGHDEGTRERRRSHMDPKDRRQASRQQYLKWQGSQAGQQQLQQSRADADKLLP